MKKFIIMFWFLCIAFGAYSQTRPKIVTYLSLGEDMNEPKSYFNTLVFRLESYLMNDFTVVDQSVVTQDFIDQVLKNQEQGKVSDNQMIRSGEQWQGDYLCYIYIRKGVNHKYVYDVKVIDIKSSVLYLRPQSFWTKDFTDDSLNKLGKDIADYILNKTEFYEGVDYVEKVNGVDIQMIYVEKDSTSFYYISAYEITEYQWNLVMEDAGTQNRKDMPKHSVSWGRARDFCIRLSKISERKYSLPTSDEWEFAARGGKKSKEGGKLGYVYSGSNNIDQVAWYKYSSSNDIHPVGELLPNALGIYDMSGNLWEWCDDSKKGGKSKVIRGGAYDSTSKECEISAGYLNHANAQDRNCGFRIVYRCNEEN